MIIGPSAQCSRLLLHTVATPWPGGSPRTLGELEEQHGGTLSEVRRGDLAPVLPGSVVLIAYVLVGLRHTR